MFTKRVLLGLAFVATFMAGWYFDRQSWFPPQWWTPIKSETPPAKIESERIKTTGESRSRHAPSVVDEMINASLARRERIRQFQTIFQRVRCMALHEECENLINSLMTYPEFREIVRGFDGLILIQNGTGRTTISSGSIIMYARSNVHDIKTSITTELEELKAQTDTKLLFEEATCTGYISATTCKAFVKKLLSEEKIVLALKRMAHEGKISIFIGNPNPGSVLSYESGNLWISPSVSMESLKRYLDIN